jgi:hypothetical protein
VKKEVRLTEFYQFWQFYDVEYLFTVDENVFIPPK